MVRYLPILLGACVTIVCGLIGAVGVRELAQYEKIAQPPVQLTFDEFFNDRPADTYRFKLTGVRHGANVYPVPRREAGEWETVYVCLFPDSIQRLSRNYISIIVAVEGANGPEELSELLAEDSLEVYYWPNKQSLPAEVYDRMAIKYRGMRFDDCLYCESGGPPPSQDFGNSCIYVGVTGVGLSVFSIVMFYLVRMIGSFMLRKRDPWYDEEEEQQITNKAGLPTG